MLGAMMASGSGKKSVADNSILRIELNGALVDRSTSENPLNQLLGRSKSSSQGLDVLIDAVKTAKNDKRIKGIYLEGGAISSDFATLQEFAWRTVGLQEQRKVHCFVRRFLQPRGILHRLCGRSRTYQPFRLIRLAWYRHATHVLDRTHGESGRQSTGFQSWYL